MFLGVIVTGVQVAGIETFHTGLLGVGSIAVFGSLVARLATYSESDLYLGPNQDHVRQLSTGWIYGNEWDDDLLSSMGFWIAENHDDIEWNGQLLTVTQILLALGVLLVALAVVFDAVVTNAG